MWSVHGDFFPEYNLERLQHKGNLVVDANDKHYLNQVVAKRLKSKLREANHVDRVDP